MEPLVSIITPCYNGEPYLGRFFQSLLNQSYQNIEIVFVNDGSTDRTEELAMRFRSLFANKGISFTYVKQNNAGQAAAMNTGFPLIKGKYFIWPDSDDVLHPDSIDKRVSFLEEHPDYGFVRSSGCYVDGNTEERIQSFNFSYYNPPEQSDIFLDLINETTFCCCGCYMIRTEAFRKMYPENKIYESRAGQNWQILIPVAGRYKCGYVDDELYYITVHPDSHSRHSRSFTEQVEHLLELKKILEIGIKKADRHDLDYTRIVELKYMHLLYNLYLSTNKKTETKEYYTLLLNEGELSEGERRAFLKKWNPVYYWIYRVGSYIKRIFFRVKGI